ncbi:hypothetical protein A2U01_0080976, partial [Trifolium medium]|nr:hypothetical protein [Trifolium medium]
LSELQAALVELVPEDNVQMQLPCLCLQ